VGDATVRGVPALVGVAAEGVAVGRGVGLGVGLGVGTEVGFGVGTGVGFGVGVGVALTTTVAGTTADRVELFTPLVFGVPLVALKEYAWAPTTGSLTPRVKITPAK
jgi:hypothetical protein